ncbi:MAG TPA: carbohydrate kinase family protein [Chthonomonadaceae bacterium]|nr:carbohydrate kinase family protein [Chthonomonadaceae bacterium]
MDILCVADLCMDLIVSGNVVPQFHQIEQMVDDYAVELGGSATIFASQFAKLGGKVGLLGAVGEDVFGKSLYEGLEAVGVDMRRVTRPPGMKTGLGLALVKPDGDRATLTYSGTIDATPPEALTDDLLTACRHWHHASLFLLNRLRGHWKPWLQRCKAAGLTVSMDTNWDPENRWEGVHDLLPLVDVFLPNEAEALAISGAADVEEAGKRLAEFGPLVVVKRGGDGATAFHKGQRWHIAATEGANGPINVVDAVGAGDNFDAGFVRAWLLGKDVPACLLLGTRCACASLGVSGGVRGQLQERIE